MIRKHKNAICAITISTALAIITACSFTDAHSDYLSNIELSGVITIVRQTDKVLTTKIQIEVRDINLDDARGADQRQMLIKVVESRKEFSFKDTYFWGSSAVNPILNGEILITLSAEGCQNWKKKFKTSKIINQERVFVIALGKIDLVCI